MGNCLSYKLGDQYVPIGFLFSQGTFTAVSMKGESYTGLETQTLDAVPKENSLNALMYYAGDYYISFDPDLYQFIIYFEKSTASQLL